MIKGYLVLWLRRSNWYHLFLVSSIILLFISEQSYSISITEPKINLFPLHSPVILTNTFLQLIFIIPGVLVIILVSTLFLSKKLRKINRELHEKIKKIQDINISLKRTNDELADQKEQIKKEHYITEKFYEMLVQSASDGFSFYDRDWKLKFANTAFYAMIGYDKHSFSNLDPASLIHPEDREYQLLKEQTLINNGFYESELRLKHRDERFVNILKKSVVVRNDNGEVLGFLTISRDVSKLRQVHEDLIKANFDAEASSRLKSSFLANISHEIRTPLNSVVGFSNLLLADDITKKVKEEYIEQINHNSEKLLQIIGDIIDLSRLESSQIEIAYEETSLNEIVNEIIEDARQVIKRNEKSIILKVKNQFEEIGDLIFADRIWLKRVLNHLMDNAVKFTLEGSVEFNYYLENDKVVFIIRDTGIGINKENLSRIFEEFRQEIGGHHRPFEGLGIGLTLAKEVVERMGGKIYVKSEKGVGSEFGFSIPYRPAGSSTTKIKAKIDEQVIKAINWSSRKCLLVDDNKDVLIYLIRILLDTGISAITARSGVEAIEIIKNNPDIDVILLDMQMPELNGIDTAREIRRIRKNLPIIAQTAFIFEDDKDIILEAGCDACLIKPIRKDHLITVMASFMATS